jgi:O-antigen/teichoic acid export membrane protein
MLKEGFWVLFGSFSAALAARIDYITLGFFMGVRTLGIYVFAYEMTAQLPILVWGSLMAVLFPVLTRLSMDQRLFAEAAQAFIIPAFLAVGVPSLFFAAACEPIELLLWGGKWSAAVPLMQLFACAAPIRIMLLVPEAMLLAMGSFRQRAFIILARAAAVGVAATCAGILAPADIFTTALLVAITQAVIALATAVLILRLYRCQISRLARPMLTSMVALAGTAFAVAALDATYLDQSVTPLARTVLLSAVYALLSMLALRIFVPQETKKLVQILPRRARSLATLVLLLRDRKG